MIEFIAIPVTSSAIALSAYLLVQNRRLKKKASQLLDQKVRAENRASQIREEMKEAKDFAVAAEIKKFKDRFEADNAHLISQALVSESVGDLRVQLKSLIETKFNRTSQEFLGVISDDAEGLARELQIELCDRIWDAFQGFKEVSKETPYIFPDGAKVAYTKGQRSVIIIEQKPQVRTVSFNEELVKSRNVAKLSVGRTESGYRYTLAFPYVYFVLVFDKGKYTFHELYFRNKPLTSVREHIYLAPLPNVFRGEDRINKAMCMGHNFRKEVNEELTIARQVDLVIAEFWQKTFNADLGTGGHENVDKRIKNFAIWQKNTEEDPLFVLGVNWPKGKTLKGVVEKLLDDREHKHALDPIDQFIRQQLESGVAKLTTRIKEEILSVKQSGFAPNELDARVDSLVEEVIVDHAKRVFDRCTKQR